MAKRKDNKDIVQSYIWTIAKYEANAYEKRILYRILESIQCQLEGKNIKGLQVTKTLFDDRVFRIPTSMFLKDNEDQHYTEVKSALRSLRNRDIEFDNGVVWKVRGIIEKPVLEYRGWVEFEVCPEVYSCMLNFVKGYRKFELLTAMSFKSEYTMRFYELFSGQKTPITYKISDLKEIFLLQDKYSRASDFIKYVIEPAKRELDEKSPYSFEYNYTDKEFKIGKKFHLIRFIPVAIPRNRDEVVETKALQKQVNISWDLDKTERDYFLKFGFTERQLKNNMQLILQAKKELDLVYELSILVGKVRDKKNPQGYVIGALRGKLKDKNLK